ncbi:hypothetical protein ACFSM5_04550 [Lacibacterium aquatile]|uniref:Uncharacterized protein n=1 Tax=Lacibacterium aquatile TaxID=1168082 RepID=A0ABW5DRI5_9PROT
MSHSHDHSHHAPHTHGHDAPVAYTGGPFGWSVQRRLIWVAGALAALWLLVAWALGE